MTKEFDDLIRAIPAFIEKKKKEYEEETFRFYGESEDGQYIVLRVWENNYIFDREGYSKVEELWNNRVLSVNEKGYLCMKDKDTGELIDIHRYLKRKEVEELAKKLNCPTNDIHVHHKNIKNPDNKFDNRLENLEVLHKDKHAQKHGYLSWELLLKYRNKTP